MDSEADKYPAAFRKGRVVRAYNVHDEIIAAEVAEEDPEAVIHEMLNNPDVSFLQVRSVTRGCYTMKVDRA